MELWEFCLALYQRPNIKTLCLDLQDQHNGNVSLILWLCWHEVHHRTVTEDTWQYAKTHVEHLHQTLIVPLRNIRKSPLLKKQEDYKSVKEALLQGELLLEKSVLQSLNKQTQPLLKATTQENAVQLKNYLDTLTTNKSGLDAQFLSAARQVIRPIT